MKGTSAGRQFFVTVLALLLIGLSVGTASPATAAESQNQSNAALVRRAFADVLSSANPAALTELFSTGYRHFDGGTPGVALGAKGVGLRLALYRQAMPDLSYQIEDLTAVDNRVITRWRASGTYTSRFQLHSPSGSVVQWEGITIWQVDDGQIHVAWSQQDDLGLLRQLQAGAQPAQLWGPAYYR